MFFNTIYDKKFYLSSDIVHQSIHARLHAEAVLAWQQLRVPVPVQADAARQQLFELFHLVDCFLNSLEIKKTQVSTNVLKVYNFSSLISM